jgi:hypothetical protein
VGNSTRADELLDKITEDAIANDYLIPELYEPNSGEYAGVVPMVGYGAGAWQLSQLYKYDVRPPTFGVGFEACVERPVVGGEEVSAGAEDIAGTEASAGAEANAGTEANGGTESNAGTRPSVGGSNSGFMPNTNNAEEDEKYDWENEPKASFCDARTGAFPSSLVALWLCIGLLVHRRRHLA